jgi:NADH-quinone oxidoreductase subunit N
MFVALAPFYIISATLVLLMLIISFFRNHAFTAIFTFAGLAFAFISIFNQCFCLPHWAEDMLFMDSISQILIGISLLSAMMILVFSYNYFKNLDDIKEEYYVLFLAAILGTMIMIASRNFLSFFLGLEILSIPLYVMIAYKRNDPSSVEASIKYLILASASTAALIFGLALMYAASGTLDIYTFALYLGQLGEMPSFVLAGLALFIAAIGFKLALAPFHVWSPDVYQGSPVPVTAFIASIAKVGAFIFLFRLVTEAHLIAGSPIYVILIFLSALSMFLGNLLALPQTNIKRILALSSVAHMGYLIIPLVAGGNNGYQASVFYIIVYLISNVGVFGVLSVLSSLQKEPENIDDLKNLYHRSPFLAIVLAASLISLAGMPLTAGFIAKIYLAFSGASASLWWLVIILIINSGIGLYYYIKMVTTMFKSAEPQGSKIYIPLISSIALAVALIIIVWLGVSPGGVLYIIIQ